MVDAIGEDTSEEGYAAIVALTRALNSKFPSARDTQLRTIGILQSLFPGWLPRLFAVMFARPFPEFSAQMNAWATWLTTQWLMGPSAVNDIERPDGTVGKSMGVKVERCRYLEETGCASICINSCKVPTQEFFEKHMGLQLRMTPNYDDFSCQYAFGVAPLPESQDEAFTTPCFVKCPSKVGRRPGSSGPSTNCGGIECQ